MFDIIDGKVVLDAEELAIPVFKQIYNSDKTKDKQIAFNKISYIIFMYKWNNNPYTSIIDEEVRSKVLKKELFDDENWKPDELVKQGIERYKQFINTFSLQFLEQNILGATKLMDYYSRVNWDEVDKSGKPIYSSRDLAANLEKAGGILRSLESLKDQVRKEELQMIRTRGNNEVHSYEDAHSMKAFQ
jgi:hypothetical protein